MSTRDVPPAERAAGKKPADRIEASSTRLNSIEASFANLLSPSLSCFQPLTRKPQVALDSGAVAGPSLERGEAVGFVRVAVRGGRGGVGAGGRRPARRASGPQGPRQERGG